MKMIRTMENKTF